MNTVFLYPRLRGGDGKGDFAILLPKKGNEHRGFYANA